MAKKKDKNGAVKTDNAATTTTAKTETNAASGAAASGTAATGTAASDSTVSENIQKDKEKKHSLFREKSLEKIESPEKLNDYLRVTSPGVWIILTTVIILLVGVCIWAIFGRIDATTPAAIVTKEGDSICLVPASALEGVIANRTVTVDGEDKELNPSVLEPQVISETTDVYIILAGNFSVGDVVYPIELAEPLEKDGVLQGTLVTETLTPASLFFEQ